MDTTPQRLPLLVRAAGLGLAVGGRSTLGPAAVAATGTGTPDPAAPEPLRALSSPRARRLSALAVAGELTADKLSWAPSRLLPPSLVFRTLSGAVSSAALAQRSRRPVAAPALVGATAAVVWSVLGLRLRTYAGERGLPTWLSGLLEDALVVPLAWVSARG